MSPILFGPPLLNAVWLTVLTFVTFLCTDDLPPVTQESQGEATVCQLVEMEHSFLSKPHTLHCDLGTGVFLHQNLQPNKITISILSLWFSFCFSLTVLLAFLCCLYLYSHLHSLSLCLSLHLFFPHYSRTPFPPGSQATKYSDWCRQLGLITNGKQSKAEQWWL